MCAFVWSWMVCALCNMWHVLFGNWAKNATNSKFQYSTKMKFLLLEISFFVEVRDNFKHRICVTFDTMFSVFPLWGPLNVQLATQQCFNYTNEPRNWSYLVIIIFLFLAKIIFVLYLWLNQLASHAILILLELFLRILQDISFIDFQAQFSQNNRFIRALHIEILHNASRKLRLFTIYDHWSLSQNSILWRRKMEFCARQI